MPCARTSGWCRPIWEVLDSQKSRRQQPFQGIRETIEFNPVIASFGDRATEDLYHGRRTSRVRRLPPDIVASALRKMDVIRAAHRLQDLRSPPGNRLEALSGNYEGFYSIRVNQQWRLVFRWEHDSAYELSLKDYH